MKPATASRILALTHYWVTHPQETHALIGRVAASIPGMTTTEETPSTDESTRATIHTCTTTALHLLTTVDPKRNPGKLRISVSDDEGHEIAYAIASTDLMAALAAVESQRVSVHLGMALTRGDEFTMTAIPTDDEIAERFGKLRETLRDTFAEAMREAPQAPPSAAGAQGQPTDTDHS